MEYYQEGKSPWFAARAGTRLIAQLTRAGTERAVHSNPKKSALNRESQRLIARGLFYLRYRTGDLADNMRNKGRGIVAEYIRRYAASMKWMIAAFRGKQAEAAQDAGATIKNRYRRPAPTVLGTHR